MNGGDWEQSILSYLRRSSGGEEILIVCNFTPAVRHNYRVGVPDGGRWREILNTDAPFYGGSGQGNLGGVEAAPVAYMGKPWSVVLTLPPLAVVFLKAEGPLAPDAIADAVARS